MEDMYTPQEVAFKLKIGYRTVLDLINLGKLEAYEIGNRYRVTESSLLRYLNSIKAKRAAV